MLRRTRLMFAVVFLAAFATACVPPEMGGFVMGCNAVQGTLIVPADALVGFPVDMLTSMPIQVQDVSGNVLGVGYVQLAPVDADNVLFSLNILVNPSQPEGTVLMLVVDGGAPLGGFPCSGTPITSFNPGDGRVNPQPWDRLAIYCNQPSGSVDVWGVDDQSKGFRLATFSLADLKAAGPSGLGVDAAPNGVISLSEDEQGNMWAAWNGGQYNADGQADHGFAKGFGCN